MFAHRSASVVFALIGVLVLVAARPSGGSGADERYVVRPGDTLWELAAERYGGDPREGVWRIRERNRLQGASLSVGAILYLPALGG